MKNRLRSVEVPGALISEPRILRVTGGRDRFGLSCPRLSGYPWVAAVDLSTVRSLTDGGNQQDKSLHFRNLVTKGAAVLLAEKSDADQRRRSFRGSRVTPSRRSEPCLRRYYKANPFTVHSVSCQVALGVILSHTRPLNIHAPSRYKLGACHSRGKDRSFGTVLTSRTPPPRGKLSSSNMNPEQKKKPVFRKL